LRWFFCVFGIMLREVWLVWVWGGSPVLSL